VAEFSTPARDLKPGDKIRWNGAQLTVKAVEIKPAPWIHASVEEVHIHVEGVSHPLYTMPHWPVSRG
jgi:hypothetical protein